MEWKWQSIMIEKVSHLIDTTNMSIGEIADMIGYSEKTHLSRDFKKYKGMTPLQYRHRHRG